VSKDQALVLQAQANLGRDEAQLKTAGADAKRYEDLFKQGIAARNQYDQVRTTFDAQGSRYTPTRPPSRAPAPRSKAIARRLSVPQLDLAYCDIHSPSPDAPATCWSRPATTSRPMETLRWW